MRITTLAGRIGVATAVFLMVASCEGPPQFEFVEFGASKSETQFASIVAVLADPRRFVGQRVRLQGVLNLEFEGDQICLDRPSLESFATTNCLRLGLNQELRSHEVELTRWNGRYAMFEGTVQATGTFDHYPARLDDVSHVLIVTSRRRI